MQSHERIRLAPVAAYAVAPVDHGHVDVDVVDQCVDETHSHGPRADHEVVAVQTAGHETHSKHVRGALATFRAIHRFSLEGLARA